MGRCIDGQCIEEPPNDNMSTFAARERLQRLHGAASTTEDDARFLERLNAVLADTQLESLSPDGRVWPQIWILGLPRGGTTLAMQLLTSCLEVGYINNVIARFWRAPLTGIRLSKAILGSPREQNWTSHFGTTSELGGPHEFSYFWQHWLLMHDMPPYDPLKVEEQIDWKGLQIQLDQMSAEFRMPMVHKAMLVSYHLPRVATLFPDSIFVRIRREPVDVACSLAAARRYYYGSDRHWWSMFTPDYESLVDEPGETQIAAQVLYFLGQHDRATAGLAKQRVYETTYEALCEDPAGFVTGVRDCLMTWSGVSVERTEVEVPILSASGGTRDDNERQKFAKALEEQRARY